MYIAYEWASCGGGGRADVSHAVGASSQLSVVTVVRPCPEVRLLVKGTDESADDGADDGGDDDDADDGATKTDYRHCYCDRCVWVPWS